MNYDWYKIFNLTEWLATQLVSRKLTFFLEDKSVKEILVTQGNETCVTFDDVFLPLNFASKNPYAIPGYAIYQDANLDVWIGFEVAT